MTQPNPEALVAMNKVFGGDSRAPLAAGFEWSDDLTVPGGADGGNYDASQRPDVRPETTLLHPVTPAAGRLAVEQYGSGATHTKAFRVALGTSMDVRW